jgi:competence protein ComEC
MPMALLSLVAMPFGLEAGPLTLMHLGLLLLLLAAEWVAGLPFATSPVPAFPVSAFALIILGGLWFIIWRRRWRLLGLALAALGLALAPFSARYDVLVDRDGHRVAIRGEDGSLAPAGERRASFALQNWLLADGDGRSPQSLRSGPSAWRCDAASCLAIRRGYLVAYAYHPSAAAEDCRRADIVIMPFRWREPCVGARLVIEGGTLREKGAHGVMFTSHGIRADTTAESRGRRPWAPSRQSPPRHAIAERLMRETER